MYRTTLLAPAPREVLLPWDASCSGLVKVASTRRSPRVKKSNPAGTAANLAMTNPPRTSVEVEVLEVVMGAALLMTEAETELEAYYGAEAVVAVAVAAVASE